MGRRKLFISRITDGRKRSATFSKRKAGLFKKAHELGVLCSVDVAVIIFDDREGRYTTLYEYCSTNADRMFRRRLEFEGHRDSKGASDFASLNQPELSPRAEADFPAMIPSSESSGQHAENEQAARCTTVFPGTSAVTQHVGSTNGLENLLSFGMQDRRQSLATFPIPPGYMPVGNIFGPDSCMALPARGDEFFPSSEDEQTGYVNWKGILGFESAWYL